MSSLVLPRRRGLLAMAAGLIIAPAVVRADSIMRVVAPKAAPEEALFDWWLGRAVLAGADFSDLGHLAITKHWLNGLTREIEVLVYQRVTAAHHPSLRCE